MKIDSPQPLYQLTFEGSWPMAVTFVGSSHRLAAGNQAGEIYLWELPEGDAKTLSTEQGSPDQNNADSKTAQRADSKDAAAPNVWPTRKLEGHTNAISKLLATQDGTTLISSSFDGTVRLWNPLGPTSGQTNAILDPEQRQKEAKKARNEEAMQRPGVDVATVAPVSLLAGHDDWIHALNLSGDEQRIISGDASAQVVIWSLKGRREVARWKGHPWNWIVAAALSQDGTRAIVSEYRYKRDDFDIPAAALREFTIDSGEVLFDYLKAMFPKYDPEQNSYGSAQIWRQFVAQGLVTVEYSPDGNLLAVGQGGETDTGKIQLLERTTGKLVRELSGHQYGITDLRFSQDGKYLVSVGRDTTLRICQVDDGKEVAKLGSPRGGQFKDWLSAIAISPDQSQVAATDIAGIVHVWKLTNGS